MTNKNFSAYAPFEALNNLTILNGATESDVIDCFGGTPLKIFIPAAFDTANLTYACSADGITFSNPLKLIDGTVVTTTGVIAGDCINLDAAIIAGVRYLKIISSVAQTADRTLIIAGAPVLMTEEID